MRQFLNVIGLKLLLLVIFTNLWAMLGLMSRLCPPRLSAAIFLLKKSPMENDETCRSLFTLHQSYLERDGPSSGNGQSGRDGNRWPHTNQINCSLGQLKVYLLFLRWLWVLLSLLKALWLIRCHDLLALLGAVAAVAGQRPRGSTQYLCKCVSVSVPSESGWCVPEIGSCPSGNHMATGELEEGGEGGEGGDGGKMPGRPPPGGRMILAVRLNPICWKQIPV